MTGITYLEIQNFCLGLKGTTEDLKWGEDLVFSVAGKMFAIAADKEGRLGISLKSTPAAFAFWTQQPGISPAPYLARYNWIWLESVSVVPKETLLDLIKTSYDLVFQKLPKKVQSNIH